MKLRKKFKPHLKSLHLQQQDDKKSMQKYLLDVKYFCIFSAFSVFHNL
jgi:hypothetical protein